MNTRKCILLGSDGKMNISETPATGPALSKKFLWAEDENEDSF